MTQGARFACALAAGLLAGCFSGPSPVLPPPADDLLERALEQARMWRPDAVFRGVGGFLPGDAAAVTGREPDLALRSVNLVLETYRVRGPDMVWIYAFIDSKTGAELGLGYATGNGTQVIRQEVPPPYDAPSRAPSPVAFATAAHEALLAATQARAGVSGASGAPSYFFGLSDGDRVRADAHAEAGTGPLWTVVAFTASNATIALVDAATGLLLATPALPSFEPDAGTTAGVTFRSWGLFCYAGFSCAGRTLDEARRTGLLSPAQSDARYPIEVPESVLGFGAVGLAANACIGAPPPGFVSELIHPDGHVEARPAASGNGLGATVSTGAFALLGPRPGSYTLRVAAAESGATGQYDALLWVGSGASIPYVAC